MYRFCKFVVYDNEESFFKEKVRGGDLFTLKQNEEIIFLYFFIINCWSSISKNLKTGEAF